MVRRGALLACCVLVAVGCTPRQSQDQYEERLEHAIAVRQGISVRLAQRELDSAASYQQAAMEVNAALDELDADPPPSDLQAAHDRMVEGMEGLAILLDKLGRCEALAQASAQDRRACRQSIGQDVYDTIRNDFTEANTIYRQEGLSLPGLGGEDEAQQDSLGEEPDGGDAL